MASHRSRMMFWRKDNSATDLITVTPTGTTTTDSDVHFETKDVGVFSLFVPFVKNYASSMRSTKNPAKLPYPTCYYLPQSSLMHMVHLQMGTIDLLINASTQRTPEERFIGVVKYCLSTCALTKFPYKPIISLLGETSQYSTPFSGSTDCDDKTYVFAENLRKDPPYSCFHITNPKHGVSYGGSIELEPQFKQAHVHVLFKGLNQITFANTQETYSTEVPDLMIRLLRLHTELVGDVHINSSTGFAATISFKEKSLFGKVKNQIIGSITFNGMSLYTLDGVWDEVVYITDCRTSLRMELLNRSTTLTNRLTPPTSDHQLPSHGDHVWKEMLDALVRQDFDGAANLKAHIYEKENEYLSPEERSGVKEYVPRHFHKNPATGCWEINDPSMCVRMGEGYSTMTNAGLPSY